ncbi:MAG: riboflavin biosynthesis protein RibD [Chloroflexota bacterium]|nr:MAG: riboflavin biosynthesis protein RibD [Chloroflexota bacterium]
MRKIMVYNFLTINGFFKGPNEDTSWHRHGAEEARYSEEMLMQDNILLFGRKTYGQMASFWPTPMAKELFPVVAEGMNRAEKIVLSQEPFEAKWENTQVVSGNIVEQIQRLKASPGKDMAVLGSGSIINLFTDHGLIDEYQFMLDPVALPDGTPVFKGIKQKLDLQFTSSRVFKSGVVLLCYQPMKNS